MKRSRVHLVPALKGERAFWDHVQAMTVPADFCEPLAELIILFPVLAGWVLARTFELLTRRL